MGGLPPRVVRIIASVGVEVRVLWQRPPPAARRSPDTSVGHRARVSQSSRSSSPIHTSHQPLWRNS